MATGLKEKLDQAKETTALARPTATVLSIFQDEKVKGQLALAMPSGGLTAERLLRVALTEVRRNPGLIDCTRDSFLGALMTAAHLGLEIGGPLGHFYLVPFRNTKKNVREITPILGYRGMIVLARRSKEVEDVVAREVCENDQFEFSYGIEDHLVHVPAEGDRGKPIKFYGIARYTNGGHLVRVMSEKEINAYRSRSKAKDDGPWVSDYVAMACKTVIRRMAAFMPLTTEAATAIAEDEERELGYGPGELIDLGDLTSGNGTSERKQAPKGEQGSGAEATSTIAAASPATPSEPASSEPSQEPSLEVQGSGSQPAPAVGLAEQQNPASPSAEATICQICGSTDTTHDDKKHAEWAKARRAEKKAAEGEGLPLEGGS